jgi:hypothetical protein
VTKIPAEHHFDRRNELTGNFFVIYVYPQAGARALLARACHSIVVALRILP